MRGFLSLALMAGLGGCSLFKKPKPAPPAVITPPPPPKPDPPKPLTAPPKVATQAQPAPELPGQIVQTPVPPAPPKKKQPSRNQKKVARTTPAQPAVTPPAAPEPSPPPQLTTIVTPAEQQRLHQEIDLAIRSAETALSSVAGLSLNSQQKQNLRRANSFIKQANEMRSGDPATALTLAKRADALARDLASASR